MKTAPLHFFAIGTSVALALGSACTTGRLDPQTAAAVAVAAAIGQDVKSVVRDKAPLYESGPEQMTLPEAMLEKDALVRVIRTEFGYCLVETQSGKLGWVANEDLADLKASITE
jgi:hypothetical protein